MLIFALLTKISIQIATYGAAEGSPVQRPEDSFVAFSRDQRSGVVGQPR
jgi:hypothetical protein